MNIVGLGPDYDCAAEGQKQVVSDSVRSVRKKDLGAGWESMTRAVQY
jgi:hypothetical protein